MFHVTTMDFANPPRDESGAIDFLKTFFGRETYLTVSGQLAVETYAMAFRKVYTFDSTFRSETQILPVMQLSSG